MSSVVVEVDTDVRIVYVRVSEAVVARTIAYSEELLIDLDPFGAVVGIEVLGGEARLEHRGRANYSRGDVPE